METLWQFSLRKIIDIRKYLFMFFWNVASAAESSFRDTVYLASRPADN